MPLWCSSSKCHVYSCRHAYDNQWFSICSVCTTPKNARVWYNGNAIANALAFRCPVHLWHRCHNVHHRDIFFLYLVISSKPCHNCCHNVHHRNIFFLCSIWITERISVGKDQHDCFCKCWHRNICNSGCVVSSCRGCKLGD